MLSVICSDHHGFGSAGGGKNEHRNGENERRQVESKALATKLYTVAGGVFLFIGGGHASLFRRGALRDEQWTKTD